MPFHGGGTLMVMSAELSNVESDTEPLVLIFDGHCGICSRFVAWAKALDRSGRIRFVPCQQVDVRSLGVERAECEKEAIAIGSERKIHRGAQAINAVFSELPQPWPAVAKVSKVWGVAVLEGIGYRWFASHRQVFSRWGVEPECAKPGVDCN